MGFIADLFADGVAGNTPLTAMKLNKLEQGLAAADITNPASAATTALALAITAQAEPVGLSAATKTALGGTYGALAKSVDDGILSRLSAVGSTDRARSAAIARRDYDDATGFAETWTNLAAWTSSTGSQVSANRFYAASGTAGAQKAVAGLAGLFRVVANINVVTAGSAGSGVTVVGVNGSADETMGNITPSIFALGVYESGQVVSFFNGTPTNLTTIPAGLYSVTVLGSATTVSITLHNADSSVYIRRTNLRSAIGTGTALTHAVAYCSDTRFLTGSSIGGFGVRANTSTYITAKPRATVDDVPRWGWATVPPLNTDNIVVATPAGFDSRVPTPVVIYVHGSGDFEEDVTVQNKPTAIGPVAAALVSAGYIVASPLLTSSTNWGNPASIGAMEAVYRHLRDAYTLGPIVIMGHSMGGMVSLTTLARRVIPGVVGYVGIEAVYSLANMFANANYTAAIKTAFGMAADGSDYATKTAGYDPALRNGWEFRGLPMWLSSSAGDTQVNKTANAAALVTAVTPFNADITLYNSSGDHVDPTNFQSAAIVAFCNRVTAA